MRGRAATLGLGLGLAAVTPLAAPLAQAQPSVTPMLQPALTADEQQLLDDGEIGDGRMVVGSVVAGWFGLGVGQAIEGRWMESGWVYTLGEGATMTVAMAGMVCALGGCGSDRATLVMFFGGGLGFLGFRIASVVDAIRGPGEHNDRLRALRQRLGEPPRLDFSVGPSIGPALGGSGGAVAGLTLTF